MSEMGSFIELEYPKGKEYYKDKNVVRLNSGRTAIYHAVKAYGCTKVYLPYYQCETVKFFLERKGIEIKYYNIDSNFIPQLEPNDDDTAVVIVNYYGIFASTYMSDICKKYKNVIIDNSQAFYAKPLSGCLNVYSARKFFGVPDGAYVVGTPYMFERNMYSDDYSSDTSLFLLQRIEYGCEGKAYSSRMLNEERIDAADIMNMSKLTHRLLDGIAYDAVKEKRIENFNLAHSILKEHNMLDIMKFYDYSCVPMVYPFMAEKDGLLEHLISHKHFQGNWWRYLLDIVEQETIEYKLSKYMIPITIDQRYGNDDITKLCNIITEFM